MGFFDKLFGKNEEPQQQQGQGQQYGQYGQPGQSTRYIGPQGGQQGQQGQQMTDEQAIARYRYMLQTAPPETIEQAHEEAFSRLTPEQRRMVLDQLRTTLPEHEKQTAAANQDDPRSLARMATRAEMRQPGTIERTFVNIAPMGGVGLGGLMAGSFFSSMAGMFVGSMIAQQFFGGSDYNDGFADGYQEGDAQDGSDGADGSDTGDAGTYDGSQADTGGDYGAGDFGDTSGDFGGGDFGGDFGGGDFGGGDFG